MRGYRRWRLGGVALLASASVTVTWNATTIDAQGSPVTITGAQIGFDTVSRSPNGNYGNFVSVVGTGASKVISGLFPHTTYYFSVFQTDAAGNSYPSQEFTFTTP